MATNEKVLQTRIVNKHALLTEWESSTLKLKEGEIALAKVMVAQKDGTEAPTYIAKVGVEGKTFNESPMFFAPASDVHSWAKAAVKPAYGADEITRGESTVARDIQSAEDRITNLETAVGSGGSVDTQITNKISDALALVKLDEVTVGTGKIIGTIKQEDGKVTVTTRDISADDIPTLAISKISGLQDELDAKALESSVAERFLGVNTTIGTPQDTSGSNTVYGAIADARGVGNAAQLYASNVSTTLANYKTSNDQEVSAVRAIAEAARTEAEVNDQIDAKITTYNNTTIKALDDRVVANATAITNLKNTEVKANADAIAKLAQDIGNVANVMNFRGVSTSETVGADITDPKAGDVIIFGEAEYVYDESGVWVKFGDASDNAQAISDLGTRVTTVENRLNTGDIHEAIATAQAQADKGVADAAQVALDLSSEVDRATKAEAAILGTSEDASTANTVFGAKKYAEEKASAAKSEAEAAANQYTEDQLKPVTEAATALNETVTSHIANENNPHKVTKAQVGLSEVENKSTATIKSEFTGAVAADDTGFVTGGATYAAIDAAKTAVNEYTDAEVKKVDDKAVANAGDITTIKNNYARVSGNQLVYGQGDAEMVIVFNCGGAN